MLPDTPIPAAQNRASQLIFVRAWTHRYGVAQRWRRVRLAGTVLLSLAGPLVVLAAPDAGELLGALAGLWTVLARTALSDLEQRNRHRGANLQEAFDTALFGLPWNTALAGPRPAPEDVTDDAEGIHDEALRDWYPAAAGRLIRPVDTLLCQRSSVVWGRRTHSAYSTILLGLTIGWWVIGIIISVLADLTLDEYLVGLFLPSLPAFLDASELWQAHRAQAVDKGEIERDIDELFAALRAGAPVPAPQRCREIQDRIYLTRRSGPQVPPPYYRMRRERDERAMQEAAQQLVDTLPNVLRRAPA